MQNEYLERDDASTSRTVQGTEQEKVSLDDGEPIFGEARKWPAGARSASLNCDGRLYTLLNLDDESASEADISKAYKNLSLLLHPDRQPEHLRQAATSRFEEVHKAYEVLSDSHKRAVYDLLGEEGLKSTWEVSKNRAKSAAELRAEYQSQAWDEYAGKVESMVRSQGEITCTLDGRALTVDTINGKVPTLAERLSYVSRRGLSMQHSFNVPIANATTATLKGTMVHRANSGGGNVYGTIRHQFSQRLFAQIGTTFLHPHAVDTKVTYLPDKDNFVSFTTMSVPITSPPLCTVTYGQTWMPGITTFFSLKSGHWSLPFWRPGNVSTPPVPPSFSVGITSGNGKWSSEVESSANGAVLAADRKITVLDNVKVSMGTAISSKGSLSVTLSGDKRITTDTRLSLFFTFPVLGASAVTLRIRLSRLGQKITVPIILTPLKPRDLLTVIGVPAISMTALHYLYLLPRKRRKVSAKFAELRDKNWQSLGRRKAEALEAIDLMREPVAKRVAAEQARSDGLVILSAWYGPAARKSEDIDVTIPVQALVYNSALIIPGGRSKSGLLGFHDPCIGETKRLTIRYSFRGREHEATYDDFAGVTAPLRHHIVTSSL